jgi:DNA-binding SARP family transcriptional activator
MKHPLHNKKREDWMDLLHPFAHIPDALPEKSSPEALLRQGIKSITQGRYSEGIALLALVRTTEISQECYATILDAIMRHYNTYTQAQEVLFQASRDFVQAENELRSSIASLEQLLSQTEHEPQIALLPTISNPAHEQRHSTPPLSKEGNQHIDIFVGEHLPGLFITCFGRFEVNRQQQLVTLCQNRSGQAILRYLVAQPGCRATPEALMEAIWPGGEPESTRRKLQVSISALRRSLNEGYGCSPGTGYVLCKNGLYQLHPSIHLVTDVEIFAQHYEAGYRNQGSEMVSHYEQACRLYTGAFLPEDLYANWTQRRREQLSQMYQRMCGALAEQAFKNGCYENAANWAHSLLTENPCDEAAHRLLMLAYAYQGRRNEALRQYQRCEHILHDELGVSPMFETQQVFQDILQGTHEPN